MATRFTFPIEQAFDANGDPLPGAKLFFYTTGTTTPLDTYSDNALTIANTNPVIADSAGRFGSIFLQNSDYAVTLKDASDVVIYTADPVRGPAGASEASQVQVDARTATDVYVSPAKLATGLGLQGASIASAAALTLPAVGDYFTVTGTTNITSISARTAGREVALLFTGALNLTLTEGVLRIKANDVAVLRSEGAGVWRLAANRSRVVQVVSTQTGAVVTGTTITPQDDTIPQITEGNEVMTLAIVPTLSTNKLLIEATAIVAHSSASSVLVAALHQDAVADALAVSFETENAASFAHTIRLSHVMDAGTAASTTFRIRAGSNQAGTLTLNGTAGARLFGGAAASSIRITEYIP